MGKVGKLNRQGIVLRIHIESLIVPHPVFSRDSQLNKIFLIVGHKNGITVERKYANEQVGIANRQPFSAAVYP